MQEPEFIDTKKQRAVLISDEAWKALRKQSLIGRISTSMLCQRLIEKYLQAETRPPVYMLEDRGNTRQRSLYLPDYLWSQFRLQALEEGRSASALLEQLVRTFLGMELGERQNPDALPGDTS